MDAKRNRVRFSALALGAVMASFWSSGDAARAGDPRRLTVVELFTSQGCSSCPPANANLIELSKRPDVLTLSFSVTYWDRLGWKDTFGRPEFTDRQVTYEAPLGRDGPFTPQMVVNGRADAVGNRISEVERIIAEQRGGDAPSIAMNNQRLTVGVGRAPQGGADIWLVAYDKRTVNVPVKGGENTGRTLPHKDVVHSLTKLGTWSGKALTIDLPAPGPGLTRAVLIQVPNGGPILVAATQ